MLETILDKNCEQSLLASEPLTMVSNIEVGKKSNSIFLWTKRIITWFKFLVCYSIYTKIARKVFLPMTNSQTERE